MKKSRYTDSQILSILKQAEAGTPIPELCREHGMSSATFYKWRSKYGGMDASLMARMKELEDENRRLKKMYAEERLKAEVISEAMAKKWRSPVSVARWLSTQWRTTQLASERLAVGLASVRRAIGINQKGNLRMHR